MESRLVKTDQITQNIIYCFKYIFSFLSILIVTVLLIVCNKNNITENEEIDLSNYAGYLSSADFKEAVIGKWNSVFEHQGKENVNYLELTKQGKALVKIRKENTEKTYGGDYEVVFSRPPDEEKKTIASV